MGTQVRGGRRGQALVLVALALLVMMGAAGLAIDLGLGYVERRGLQNEADALALAGTQALAIRATYDPNTGITVALTCSALESRIVSAMQNIQAAAATTFAGYRTAHGFTAYYVDTNGVPLLDAGGNPISVGGGNGCTVIGGVLALLLAAGIRADASAQFGTFFEGAAGITRYVMNTTATAVNRFVTGLNNSWVAPYAIWDTALNPLVVGNTVTYQVDSTGAPYCAQVAPLDPACTLLVGNRFTGWVRNPTPSPADHVGAYTINTSGLGGANTYIDVTSTLYQRYLAKQPVFFPVISTATGVGGNTAITITGFVAADLIAPVGLSSPCLDATYLPCRAVIVATNVPASSLSIAPIGAGVVLTQATLIN